MNNRISIDIPKDVQDAVTTHMNAIIDLIQPYTVAVADEDKNSLLKLGDKTAPFVDKATAYTESAPEFNPTYLDVNELKRDNSALQILDRWYKLSSQIQRMLSDTRSLAAHDALSQCLTYYSAVKQAAMSGIAKAKSIYEDLSQRFPGRNRSTPPAENK